VRIFALVRLSLIGKNKKDFSFSPRGMRGLRGGKKINLHRPHLDPSRSRGGNVTLRDVLEFVDLSFVIRPKAALSL
jgi:hypothetical protein